MRKFVKPLDLGFVVACKRQNVLNKRHRQNERLEEAKSAQNDRNAKSLLHMQNTRRLQTRRSLRLAFGRRHGNMAAARKNEAAAARRTTRRKQRARCPASCRRHRSSRRHRERHRRPRHDPIATGDLNASSAASKRRSARGFAVVASAASPVCGRLQDAYLKFINEGERQFEDEAAQTSGESRNV